MDGMSIVDVDVEIEGHVDVDCFSILAPREVRQPRLDDERWGGLAQQLTTDEKREVRQVHFHQLHVQVHQESLRPPSPQRKEFQSA